jgi:hypothetical protein
VRTLPSRISPVARKCEIPIYDLINPLLIKFGEGVMRIPVKFMFISAMRGDDEAIVDVWVL